MNCHYSIVKYVPDEIRDEAVNIGVLIESEEAGKTTLLSKFTNNFLRASKLDPQLNYNNLIKILHSSIDQIQLEIKNNMVLNDLLSNYCGGKIQITTPRFTIANNLNDEINDIYQTFIFEEEHEFRTHGKGDSSLRREVKDIFQENDLHINGKFKYGTSDSPIFVEGKKSKYEFDFQLKSDGILDLIRCISFDVKEHKQKLDTAKVFIFDASDIKESSTDANFISILNPPSHYREKNSVESYELSKEILVGGGIKVFNFTSESDRKNLVETVREHIHA